MKEALRKAVEKYRFAALILAAGVLLMLLPARRSEAKEEPESGAEVFSVAALEKEMEQTIGRMEGVGRVEVMLTLKNGPALQLASDHDDTRKETERRTDSQIVRLNRGSGYQEVVITQQTYPTYQGAVVVCDGADSGAVRLAVTESVSVLTGLTSDRISVVKWKN